MPTKLFNLLVLALVLLVCIGCNRENRPKDLPRLFPLTLTFMLEEQPLSGAMVFLYAENPDEAKWTVSGNTDAEGKAVIVTHGQFRGAPAGKFKVCVVKVEANDAASDGPTGLVVSPNEPVSTGRPRLIHHVDPQFGDPKKTPLEIEISSKGKASNMILNVHK